ncbi:ATP phosphoribosyltransferase [Frankia sp. CNm7]|uniref:ATP phosphoribosyltransferase n=1 Tax=Frankia nepalensis TaxID=1836974 RepID=A0A937UWT8_9ACTN|nr:ATP phosphoribosyltransferase [Frankia nepalensis]MBL7496273.1 ATP phosphoribosyltransferase [Frankia nepalensis]MBL7513835.1 ATP phosphoribosyltransferase [Frankia nepalensis]MBL7517574.1 ATP phosphoribosyltransferase [Frankia nepalensis]MBL7633736.1 ATP phosphoribosyltransferase [Frankia nepalensis]
MLRIAVPNKGALSAASSQLLCDAGYRAKREGAELVVADVENDIEFFFLRPRDIAVYVGSGRLDVGITGRDLLQDSGVAAQELVALDFGHSSFRYAAPKGTVTEVAQLDGMRIATSFPGLVRADFAARGLRAEVVTLDGAVETAVRLGVADAVADVVETGRTLRAAGLELVGEPVMGSQAIMIAKQGLELSAPHEKLLRRVQGVLVARQYVMMDYDAPTAVLDKACEITPGYESPTISPLQREGWVAVRAMVPKDEVNRTMDDLWELGARGILVSGIQACRL